MARSLVVAPQWIGDAVMAEPLLAELAGRGETLTVAALPWVAPVLRAMPQVAEITELPFAHGRLDWAARKQLAATLRGRFDRAYVLPNSIKSALVPWLARIPVRVGYQGEGRWLLLNRRLPNPSDERPPMVAFYGALAGDGGVASDARPRLSLPSAKVLEALARAQVRRGAYWVFAPGAEYGPAKRWPTEHFAALARQLYAQSLQPVLLLGSGKDGPVCDEISLLAPGACRVMAGKTTLDEAMALIAAARGMVSNDSGLMHVAAGFDIPQAAVFGSTSPDHTPPHSPKSRVVWLKGELGLDCMPCFARECRYGHYRCLTEVKPERVGAALREVVEGQPAPAR
jgi:heptosyltransferase-2